MGETRNKVLVLAGPHAGLNPAVDGLRSTCEIVEVPTVDQAIDLLRRDHFTAVFSESADFLPLERALVGQQANLILNTIGEGVCIVDGEGRCSWMNKKMAAWPPRVHEKIRATCREAFDLFGNQQVPPQAGDGAGGGGSGGGAMAFGRSKRYALTISEDQQFMEMIASPVIDPATGQVVQVAAVVWDATGSRRLQQKIDAIDKAGRELVRLESEAIGKMSVVQRLRLLEEKIISFTRELMHFDHFAIRLLDRKSNKLELCIAAGIPTDALNMELFADAERNGISGYVAATGRTLHLPGCRSSDPRYVHGTRSSGQEQPDGAAAAARQESSACSTSRADGRKAAFNENDRQFADIFGRYVAIALNILDLMVVERVNTSHKVADDVCSEVAGPLNDITSDVRRR